MIPLSARGNVEHKDEDGITWQFRPQYGELEVKAMGFYDAIKELPYVDQHKQTSAFLDSVLVGWSGGPDGMPTFDGTPSRYFSLAEMGDLLLMWTKANQVSATEKKV